MTALRYVALTLLSLFLMAYKPVDVKIVQRGDSRVAVGRAAFSVDGHFVWGASVAKAGEGKYYMVFSAAPSGVHTFNNAWVMGSKLGLAVSDTPDGNFRNLGFFLNPDGFSVDSSSWDAQTVMNPHVKKFGDKYYLYYVAGRDNGNGNVKSTTDTLDLRSRIQQSLQIGVIVFDDFEDLLTGNFVKPASPLLTPRTRVKPTDIVNPSPSGTIAKPDNIITVNPSVVYRPIDNQYLLYFKGNIYDPHWRGVHGVALSDSPSGPFTPLDITVLDINTKDNEKLSAEDPYVWYDGKDKLFYAVFKDFTGSFTKSEPCLAIMQSIDGIKWELPAQSMFMKKEIELPNGEKIKVNRLERPQLLLDDSDKPMVLYVACSIDELNTKTDGSSSNIQIPLF